LFAAFQKFGTVAPACVLGIDQHHAVGVAGVLGVFSHAHFGSGGFLCQR
jgi:hypothetical protein